MKALRQITLSIMAILGPTLTARSSTAEEQHDNTEMNTLTVYFSATGTTEGIANKIHKSAGGDIYRIEPEMPYTSAELDYNSDCRANREQNDDSSRPAIRSEMPEIAEYDMIFLGYPIWWGKAPRIVQTFLENADFSGKKILPFCTSGSSRISGSYAFLKTSAPNAIWKEGRRFPASTSQDAIDEWVDSMMPTSGVEIVQQDHDAPLAYYDLQGHKITNQCHGIATVKSGTSTSKLFIK